jgi:hypothetical protein
MLRRLTNGEFALAVLVASLFWICVLIYATSYRPSDPQKEGCYQAAEKSGRSTEECKSFWEKTTSDPVAMFTLILAISTVGLWVATFSLYRAGERQIAVARTAADAAEKSAEVSERALTDLERAYIFVAKIDGELDPFVEIQSGPDAPKFIVPDFSVSIVNYGRTTGCVDLAIIRIEILREIPPEIQLVEGAMENPNAQSAEMIIGPDKTHVFDRLTFETPFTHAQGLEMRAGTMEIYCHGLLSYRDIFNNSYAIKFCRRYVHSHREWVPAGGRARNAS